MKEQMQERPGTWRFLISLVLILCAQAGLAAAQELSFSLSDTWCPENAADGPSQELLVRFAVPLRSPGRVGPWAEQPLRQAVCQQVVAGASVDGLYDSVVPGLTQVKLPAGTHWKVMPSFGLRQG